MDILDVMLARAMTPQGSTETYVAIANAAAEKAEKAEQDAAAAIATVEAAADKIAAAQEAASDLLESAQDALETAQQAQINMPEVYTTTGQNTDGYMTQKAVTDALATKANISDLSDKVTTSQMNTALAAKADASTAATKTYVDQKIAQIPSGGGSGSGAMVNFDPEDAGYLVKVGNDGELTASILPEESVIEALMNNGIYVAKNAVGLDIDYSNRTFTRIHEATNKTMGSDFNTYSMYGGRARCNVADDGTINAFYGENGYTDDGSNGQVMVYQPKFYYKRIIKHANDLSKGQVVRHEMLLLSPVAQSGFKLAPIFSGDLDYVLLPAYNGAIVNDKMVSIAGVKPLNYISCIDAEAYANARGTGWHIMNLAAYSANQMLEMVEFGTMNGQNAIEQGITVFPSGSSNGLFITGSTASLGNSTGHAASTTIDVSGTQTSISTDGSRAISYRGMENPWGNLWQMIGGAKVIGDGSSGGGTIYVCNDFNYSGNNYSEIGFNLPSGNGWVNAMGYGNEIYDWAYIPAELNNGANSQVPVGDGMWTIGSLNVQTILVIGGSAGFREECGPFYYGADRQENESARINYGAKLLYIPTKNPIYTANIAKWNTYMGG